MAGIYPVPTGRASDALLRRRLMVQLQGQQQQMLVVQQQMATGKRIQAASEDPSAASRAVSLQRLLEQKRQIGTNLDVTRSYLNSTDTALSGVAQMLADIRGTAVRAADSTTSESERSSMALEVRAAIRQMLEVGNETFRGRYLFAGSTSTTQPFDEVGDLVGYFGNETSLRSYADVGLLFDTNVPGQQLFGGVSAEVQGPDWNPILTAETRIADLRGGLGVNLGSIVLTDGTNRAAIDLSGAETVGDVVGLINAQPPAGREVRATIESFGLKVEIDAAGGGGLAILDEPGGSTAAELGILRLSGSSLVPIVGTDLDPTLQLSTSLESIRGTRARTVVRSSGANNDIVLEARQRGPGDNGVTLQFVDDNLLRAAPGLTAGNEVAQFSATPVAASGALRLSGLGNDLILTAVTPGTVLNHVEFQIDASQNLGNAATVSLDPATGVLTLSVDDTDQTTVGTLVAAINASGQFTAAPDASMGDVYNPTASVLAVDAGVRGNTGNSGGAANTIYVRVDVGASTANQVINALQADSTINGRFRAELEPADSETAALGGSRPVDTNASGTTAGGSGTDWDQSSGLQVTNGGQTYTIDLSASKTIEDLLNTLNQSDAHLAAAINSAGTGISVGSRLSGGDFSIGENGGTTATDLGLRSLTTDTKLSELNYGQGVHTTTGVDFSIRRNDGVMLDIDISSAKTVGDVVDRINNHSLNLDPNTAVVARLADTGNGIVLEDDNPQGAQILTVSRGVGSFAAWDLGLIARGTDSGIPENSPTALPATAAVQFAAPNDQNTALAFTATARGTAFNGVDIEFRNTLAGDVAIATYDAGAKRLTIDMADGQTTANTVVAAVGLEGTFVATLDLATDPTNDGSGTLVAPAGVAATTAGATAERLTGRDVNPIETQGIFNSLIRLHSALAEFDVEELQRVVALLDTDTDRLNFGRAALGTSAQGLDALAERHQEEEVQLISTLSDEIDVDMAQAVTDFTAQQISYQASLKTMANLMSLTLLDFL